MGTPWAGPRLSDPTAVLTAAGQLAALLGTYAALVQVVLMSRSPWLDSLFGIDRIAGWHRWLGFATVYLICGHVLFTTAGYAMADGRSSTSAPGAGWTRPDWSRAGRWSAPLGFFRWPGHATSSSRRAVT